LPSFQFQSVLENLPGVDPNSEAVQQAMGAMKKKDEEKKKEDEGKK
jgi:26S proteasome regulatory subunit N10